MLGGSTVAKAFRKSPVLQKQIGIDADKIGVDLYNGVAALKTSRASPESLFTMLSAFAHRNLKDIWPDYLTCLICSYISTPTFIKTYGDYMTREVHFVNYLGKATLLFRHWDPKGPEDKHELHRVDWVTLDPSLSDLIALGIRQVRIERFYHECSRGSKSNCSVKGLRIYSRFSIALSLVLRGWG